VARWVLPCICLSIALCLAACGSDSRAVSSSAASTGLRYLGGESSGGFERVLGPRRFAFPADHGPHPTFRTEWWYFTGNVATPEGRHFGFELTFFRYALGATAAGDEGPSRSRWRANQFWMGHLAITDTTAHRFVSAERFARESLGVAGASGAPLAVWVEDWRAEETRTSGFSVALAADDERSGIGLRIEVESDAAPVLQGDGGFDRKGPSEGNASYYYSLPRLGARGVIRSNGEEFSVQGLAWLDREWSTSALEGDVVGWDWFALHLTDGSSLMFYRLRQSDGGASAFSSGTHVAPDGRRTRLEGSDVELTPVREWHSAATGVRYPVEWRIRIPKLGLSLQIEPYLDQQELVLTVRYWEGAMFGSGSGPDGRIEAQGYLELAGY
jgi:predicted secreted hydrolase